MTNPKQMSDAEWKQKLTPEQYAIVRKKGTEPPFSGAYLDNKATGMYTCVACGQELFSSDTKFESHSGWPSFWAAVDNDKVELHSDTAFGMKRTEAVCSNCGAHLGHVFEDGPKPTGQRFCINSLALDFDAGKTKEKKI